MAALGLDNAMPAESSSVPRSPLIWKKYQRMGWSPLVPGDLGCRRREETL
jgi:hypothetical protein